MRCRVVIGERQLATCTFVAHLCSSEQLTHKPGRYLVSLPSGNYDFLDQCFYCTKTSSSATKDIQQRFARHVLLAYIVRLHVHQ